MSQKMQGFFEAEVLDTSMFPETGKIKVRIGGTPDPELYEMVAVLTPFGGLPNMGMQALPPIGAYGLIAYIREKDRYPIWIGSMLRYWQTEDDKVLDNGIANPVEAQDPSDFIVKTQYTTLNDQDLDGDNKVENIIKLNEEGITLAKVQHNSNYSYEKSAYSLEDDYPANTITIKDDEIKLKVRTDDDSADRVFIVNGDELKLEWGSDQSIIVNKDKTVIKNGQADITVFKDGKVEVNADKIILKGEDGTGMFYEGFRDFVNNSFNNHVHGTPSGPSGPPSAPYMSTNTAKSKNVKLS